MGPVLEVKMKGAAVSNRWEKARGTGLSFLKLVFYPFDSIYTPSVGENLHHTQSPS